VTFNPAAKIPAQRSEIERDDWQVPSGIFHALHEQHRFTIDVAANHQNRVVPRYFDREVNGLTQSWAGERAWMHPPHGDAAQWVEKAAQEARRAIRIVGLIPARTHERWWHTHVLARARVQFLCGHMPWRLGGIIVSAGQRKIDAPRGGFAIVEWFRVNDR
jgi:phage N-6-adenine-methyltransferase